MFRSLRFPGNRTAASQEDGTHSGPLRPAAAYAAILIGLTVCLRVSLLGNRPLLARAAWEWVLWMPVAVVIGMAAIVLRRGWPRGIGNTIGFAALNLLLGAVAWLSWSSSLLHTCLPLFDVAIRLAIAACWIGAACGLVPFAHWLRGRDRSAPAPAWIRWWFAATLFILLAETATRVIDRPPPSGAQLPEHWAPRSVPDGEFRIAAIGGSTMLGFPYEPRVDIPTVCAAHLRSAYPGTAVHVENAAVSGINLRTAIEQLETLETKPDLILLYTGHNEAFHDLETDILHAGTELIPVDDCLRWSAAYRAVARVAALVPGDNLSQGRRGRTLFDAPLFRDDVARVRLTRFRQTLIDFARSCRRQNIATIWFVPAAGEGTFEPNRSWTPSPISADRQETIRGLLADAALLEQSGRWHDAEMIYRDLLAENPDIAEFHYRLAEALVAQGDVAPARSSFQAAIDRDGYPCRAPSSYRQCIIDVAEQEAVPLIDAEEVLAHVTQSGLLDHTVMHDHVHPTLAGYLALGRAAADSVVTESLVDVRGETAPFEREPLDDATFLADTGFDADDLATAYERIAFALERLALRRYDPSRRLAEAARYRHWAEQLRNGDIQPGEQGTESLSQLRPGGVRLK